MKNKKEFLHCDWKLVHKLIKVELEKKKKVIEKKKSEKALKLTKKESIKEKKFCQIELKVRLIKSMIVYNRTLYEDHLLDEDNYIELNNIYEREQDHM